MTEYNELTPELISQLQAIVGEEDCHVGENISEDYSHDEMPIYGTKMPEAVCFPGNTEEVAAIMGLCNENKIPVTAVRALAWLAVVPRCRAASYCAPCT